MYEIDTPDFVAQLAQCAKLNQQIGRGKAMLEIQEWAKQHSDVLKQAGMHESLIRLTVPK